MDLSLFDRFGDFRDLDDDDRAVLAERMRRTTFRKGETLVRMLQPVQRVHVVLEGLAGLEAVSVNGIRRVMWVFRPGDLIGARVLLDDGASGSEVKALTDGEAAVLSASDLETIARSRPAIGLLLTRVLTERFQGMARRLLVATTLDVEVRLAGLLHDFADGSRNGADGSGSGDDGFRPLAYPMTHETMAEIVGASRPHVSATIGELESRGALRRGRGGKLAVHPETLARMVEAAGIELDGDGPR